MCKLDVRLQRFVEQSGVREFMRSKHDAACPSQLNGLLNFRDALCHYFIKLIINYLLHP